MDFAAAHRALEAFEGVVTRDEDSLGARVPSVSIDEAEDIEQPVLAFHGTNGAECEDFITRVRCHALEQGKIRDNDWLATFARSCCRDGALEFIDSLDDTVKGDWKQLRKALLKKYPAPLWREHKSVLSSPPSSATAQSFPEPAPAAAPPSLPPPKPLGPLPAPDPKEAEASFRGQTQKFLFKGYVKVTIPSEGSPAPDVPRFQAYIAKPLDSNYHGELKLTYDKAKALLLGYSPSQKPYAVMTILRCKCGSDCLAKVGRPFKCDSAYGVWDFLVARWGPSASIKEPITAPLVAVDTYSTDKIEQLAMWRVAPGCDLTPVRISSGAAHHAEVVIKPSDLSIRLDAKFFDYKATKLGGWKVSELRFEPL